MAEQQLHDPSGPVRIVTATSLFDGHDAAINIMRRILQAQGAEVIHLGHNRSVEEIVDAAVQEDVQAVAVSSYQGGHNEFFRYLVDRLRERGCGHIRVYGGGGGVIVASEIDELQGYGVARLFSPEDGARMGLAAMVNQIVADCDHHPLSVGPAVDLDVASTGDSVALARLITAVELDALAPGVTAELRRRAAAVTVPVLGITGTGGSGKSSLTDELILRLRQDQGDKVRLAVVAVDPTRRRTGGALLGDRIRMNAIDSPSVFFRSLATRSAAGEVPEHLDDVVAACKVAGAEVVIVETPGIGQGDGGIIGHVDTSLYVMTPEFGADSQLEKIDMLDLADTVAVNKYDRRGGADAVRAVRRQMARNRELFTVDPEDLPVFGTVAARFNDDGVTALYLHLRDELVGRGLRLEAGAIGPAAGKVSTGTTVVVPPERSRYLAEIAEAIRGFHTETARAEHRGAHRPTPRVRARSRPRRRGRQWRCGSPGRRSGRGRPSGRPRDHRGVGRPRRRVLVLRPGSGVALRNARAPRCRPAVRRPRRSGHVRPRREPPWPLPVHRRGVRVQARRRGPDPHVRGGG